MADLFISYSRQDLDQIEKLAVALEAAGLSVWWDRRIRSGDSFDRVIEHAIADAKVVIVAWSRHSADSTWVRAEAGFALEHNKLVPVRLDEVAPPLRFLHVHTIDLSARDGSIDATALARLIADLKEMVGAASTAGAAGTAGDADAAGTAGTMASAAARHAAVDTVAAAPKRPARQKAIAIAALAAAAVVAAGIGIALFGGGKSAPRPEQASTQSSAKTAAVATPPVAASPPAAAEAAATEKAAQPSPPPPAPVAPAAPPAPAASAAPAARVAPAAPVNAAADHQVEIAFWDSIKDSKNAAELEAYLQKYPEGDFAAIARGRLAALKEVPAAPAAPAPAAVPPTAAAPAQIASAPRAPVERGPELDLLEKDMVAAHPAPLRESPEIKAKQVGRLKEGESVHVAGKVKTSDWYAVEAKDQSLAYVASAVLEDPADYRKRKELERQKEQEAPAAAAAPNAPSPQIAKLPPVAAPSGKAAAGATRYVGHLACDRIPGLTNATVLAEMTIVANGTKLDFSRPVYSFDGKQAVATESGTGTLAADGSVTLEGHMQGPIGRFDSSYQGTLKGDQIELKGVENIPKDGKLFARDCKASLARK